MDELTPEELDTLLEFEARQQEQAERKFAILYRLQGTPADDPLWEKIAELLEG